MAVNFNIVMLNTDLYSQKIYTFLNIEKSNFFNHLLAEVGLVSKVTKCFF